MTHDLPVIRSASLHGYVELARSLGLRPHNMMREAGLDPRCLDDPETPISVAAARQLLESSAKAAGADDFGLRLLNASLLTLIEDIDDLVIIREEILLEGAPSVRQSIELAIGVMFRILLELLGPAWKPRRVCFTHRPPADMAIHRALFGSAIEFNSGFNGIVCSASDLAARLPVHASGMSPYARRFLEQALSGMRGNSVDSARQLIAALLPGGRCTADQVAQHLGVDRRTLHRHLLSQGTSFSLLLKSIRAEFAKRQIRDSDRSLAELAELLGFSGSGAFAYWFRQQFGCTVSQWRARSATSS